MKTDADFKLIEQCPTCGTFAQGSFCGHCGTKQPFKRQEVVIRPDDVFYFEIAPFNDDNGYPTIFLHHANRAVSISIQICGQAGKVLADGLNMLYEATAERNACRK